MDVRNQEAGQRTASPWLERLVALPPIRALLGVPLFYKILLANVTIVLLSAVVATLLALTRLGGLAPGAGQVGTLLEAVIYGGILAAVLSLVLNAFLLGLALSPLRRIEDAARRVADGDMKARAPTSPLADADHRSLAEVFNHMLDTLETSRVRQRQLALRVLSAEEGQRQRVAWELYNGAAQTLASILLRIRLATGHGTAAAAGSEVEFLQELRSEVLAALESIQGLARRLRPPELDDLGLLPAIEAQARSVSELTGVRVTVDCDGTEPELGTDTVLTVYRIVEEALRNVARHADATEARVAIRQNDATVHLEVQDDGVGFELEEALERAAPTAGILGMQERAEYLGGRMTMETGGGTGTRIHVQFPLRRLDRAGPPPGESRALDTLVPASAPSPL